MRALAPIAVGIIIIIILISSSAVGDVAPDFGYRRISLKLVLESNDDLSEYRFFIKSGADLEEVFIKRSEQTVVSPLGGGAYYSSGQLLAVTRKELDLVADAPGEGRLSGPKKAVYDGRMGGAIELMNHIFSRQVLEAEASGYKDPVYRIERDPRTGLRTVHNSGGANFSETSVAESTGLRSWRSRGGGRRRYISPIRHCSPGHLVFSR